jgi:anti-sigma B factor antagonist
VEEPDNRGLTERGTSPGPVADTYRLQVWHDGHGPALKVPQALRPFYHCANFTAQSLPQEETMDIKERVVDGVSILDLAGKIVLGEGDMQIKERIRELLNDGQKRILLNLEGVSYIDSAGLGALISSYTTTRREGGNLKLVNLTKRIQDLLAITKLITVFDTFEDEKKAIASF